MTSIRRATHSQPAIRYALGLLFPLLAAYPLWGAGMVNTRGGGDSPFLLWRTMAAAEALRSGHVPIRWMAHAAYDLGYPFFNYYAALPYYLSGGLTVLGLDPILAIQTTQTLGFLLAALSMALWARRLYRGNVAIILAVAAYTFAPFHLVNVYVRGDSLSEFYAFVWFPLILWALDRLITRPNRARLAVAALAYAALVLTHNVSAFIFTPFALLYVLMRAVPSRPVLRRWIVYLAPFALGALLAAWFWLPALAELREGQMGTAFTEGYFHYSHHFRGANLIQRTLAFDYRVAVEEGAAGPFAMGAVQAGLALVGAVIVTLCRCRRWGYLLIGLVLATMMITPLSRPLWDALPFLAVIQFPWRFLSVQALFTAMATAALGDELVRARSGPRALRRAIPWGLVGLLLLAALADLRPERLPIAESDVTWDRLQFYESFTGNIGTTIRYEYLPRHVVPRPYISEALVEGEGRPYGTTLLTATRLTSTPAQQQWQITLTAPGEVVFPLHWWPGWRITVDGEAAVLYPIIGSGRAAARLPAGVHDIRLELGSTPWRTLALLLSLAALGVTVWLLTPLRPNRAYLRAALTWGAATLLLSLAPLLFRRGVASGSGSFFDFLQMPYPHAGPVNFGAVQLLKADVAPTVAAPGEALTVTLHWSAFPLPASPLTATLALVSPAEPRHDVPYRLAEVSFAVPAEQVTLPLPADLSRGLYLVALRLYQGDIERTPRTPQGQGMGTLYIGTVRVPHGPPIPAGATVLATFPDLALHALEATQPDPETLRLKLSWSTPQGTPRNWSLSFRLLDADGRLLAQADHQPGYGYLPTTLWLPGEQVTDLTTLPLPEGLAPGRYTFQLVTYLRATMMEGGTYTAPLTLTEVTLNDPRFSCCEQKRKGLTVRCHLDGLYLTGLVIPETLPEGAPLEFYAIWNALEKPPVDMEARWEVLDGVGEVLAATEGPLAPGSRTSTWPRLTWVRAPVRLELPPVLPAGPYHLRVTMMGAGFEPAVCDIQRVLPIKPRPRSFVIPTPAHPQRAEFGSELRLLGYDLAQGRTQWQLTLWWQALRAPSRDYKRFVHLFDPATEQILAQDDAMPRDWRYPTSWWAAGEVVSETVRLDVERLPLDGARLAVGWYDAASGARLPAFAADGTRFPADRVILDIP